MCGFAGIVRTRTAALILLEAVPIAYPGHGSPGVSTLVNGHIGRVAGKLDRLVAMIKGALLFGRTRNQPTALGVLRTNRTQCLSRDAHGLYSASPTARGTDHLAPDAGTTIFR